MIFVNLNNPVERMLFLINNKVNSGHDDIKDLQTEAIV